MKSYSNLRRSIWAIVLALLFFIGMCFTAVIHHRAKDVGNELGSAKGMIVGRAVGSARGFTRGIADGSKAGTVAGLSADDTTVDVRGTFTSMGKLEVLVAGVTIKDMHEIGKAYSGLLVINGDAVFTVDLSKTETFYNQDGTIIRLVIPQPEMQLYINQNSTKKLAETQKFSWTATAEDGIQGYLNSMVKTQEKVESAIVDYESLISIAKESAIEQISVIARDLCGNGKKIEVDFKG